MEHGELERVWTQKECFGEEESRNSTFEDNDVSNRHMTWWKRSRWIRNDDGSSMRSTRGRRSGRRARDGDGVGETQRQAEEAEGEKWGRRKGERQTRQRSEKTLHIVWHLPTTAATKTAGAAAATRALQ